MLSPAAVEPRSIAPQAEQRRSRGHRWAVAILSTAAALLYGACSFQHYLTFRSDSYDLVIFDQAVRSYSRFHLPVSVIKGVHDAFVPGFSLLGDHFSPVLALLAPLYWIHDGPATLLVAQALLLASAIGPLWAFTRRELGAFTAYCVSVGYAVSWPVSSAAAFDFHEAAFAPVLFAVLFERASAYWRGRAPWWQLALPAAALLCVKEDTGLMLTGFGAAMLLHGRGAYRRRDARVLAAVFVAGGLAMTALATRVLIPAFGGRSDYYWRYEHLGRTVTAALGHLLAHPVEAARTFVTPRVKVHTMVRLLAVAAAAPLASPYLLVVLPALAERMLAAWPTWWVPLYHYNSYLIVPLLCAGVDAVVRLRRWLGRLARPVVPVWSAAVVAVAALLFDSSALYRGLQPDLWRGGPDARAAELAIVHVPSGVVVEAAEKLGPRLSGRTTVVYWDRLPRGAPWVVADVQRPQLPFCHLADQRQRVAQLKADGYQVVYAVRGYVVLHHPGPLGPLDYSRAPGCG